jgi:plasmid maintenance system antidote protein VapI
MPKIFAIHPGEILKEEFMMPLELTAYRLATLRPALRTPDSSLRFAAEQGV